MKRILILILLVLSCFIVEAQLKVPKGIIAKSGDTLSINELNTLNGVNTTKSLGEQLNDKVNEVDKVLFSTYFGVDSLIYNSTRKRWQYLSSDNFWRTINISDSTIVENWSGLKTGLTSAWEFDETSGTDAVPAIGTLHGTATGGVTVNQTGKLGKCWVLDNTNGYISFADDALVDLTNNWTISIWFNAANYSTNRYIFTKGGGMFSARINSTGPQFRFLTTALTPSAANASTFTPAAGVWNHLVLTYSNGVGVKVYWNGVYKETLAMSGTLATDNFPLLIGRYTGTEIFNGSIDQLCIWKSRVLTDADVILLNNSNNGRLVKFF